MTILGFVGRDVSWERLHGRAKRVAVIADLLYEAAKDVQRRAAGAPNDAPHINEDAAMLLVDQQLQAGGSLVSRTRDDVRAAIAYMTPPMVGLASKASGDPNSFVAV